MKYLIFLCLVGVGLTSCREAKPPNFELRKATVFNLNDAYFQHYFEAQSYIRGFKEVCEGEYYPLKTGRPHIQCMLYSDMMQVHNVFKEYYKLISICENELGIKHEYVDYFHENLVENFPEDVFFEKKFNEDQIMSIKSTVKFIDPFFDSLTELFIKISPVVNELELYDLALRHRRRESLEKVREIYKSYPVYMDDKSIYESCYLLGIKFDFTESLNNLESNLDYLILLNSLKFELSFLERSIITRVRSRMGYGGPNSTVFEPEIVVEGPTKVLKGEAFTLIPRHLYQDMWEVYEVEFGGELQDGKFRIVDDTVVKGVYKRMMRNGKWAKYPFEKEIKVYKD